MHAHEPDPQRLRRHLQALPDPVPPATLEARLLAAQGRRSRLLRTGATVVALCMVVLVAMPDPGRLPGPDAPARQQAARETTRLKLQAIDRALQTAYARGASDDELAPLWEARTQLMRSAAPTADAARGSRS